MGFVLDMVTGEVSSDDLVIRQDVKGAKAIDYAPLEYCENLSEGTICPDAKVEESFIPEHIRHVDIDQFVDEIDNLSHQR